MIKYLFEEMTDDVGSSKLFDTADEAISEALDWWGHLTKSEKQKVHCGYVAEIEITEEALAEAEEYGLTDDLHKELKVLRDSLDPTVKAEV